MMSPRETPDELGRAVLALRIATEAERKVGRLPIEAALAVTSLANELELALRRLARQPTAAESAERLQELRRAVLEACGEEVGGEVLALMDRELSDEPITADEGDLVRPEVEPPEAGPADPGEGATPADVQAVGEDSGGIVVPVSVEEPLDLAGLEYGARNIIQVLAILLVVGGTIASAFALWESEGTWARAALVAIPAVFCAAGLVSRRFLSLPRTGTALLTLTLFLIPPTAVASSAAFGVHAFAVFGILAVLIAVDTRLVLRRNTKLVGTGLILLVGATVFHSYIYRTLSFGTIYLLAAIYSTLMALDFIARVRVHRSGGNPIPGLLSTGGILTYTAGFAVLCVVIQDERSLREEVALMAPAVLLLAGPGFFHGSLLFLRGGSELGLRLAGAVTAFSSLVCSLLSLVLTLMQGWPLLVWSAIVTPLCLAAAIVFRLYWVHHAVAIGLTILMATAAFLVAAPPGTDYPWNHLPLDELVVQCIPLPYIFAAAGLLLERRGSVAGMRYVKAAIFTVVVMVVLSVSVSSYGMPAAITALAGAPILLLIGAGRAEAMMVAAAGILTYVACGAWWHGALPAQPVAVLGLAGALLAGGLLVGAALARTAAVELPLLGVSLCGATAATVFALSSFALDPRHTATGLCCALVFAIGGWRVKSPGLLIAAFATLLLVTVEGVLRAAELTPTALLDRAHARWVVTAVAAALLGVGAAARRTARLEKVVAAPAREVALVAAFVLGMCGLDSVHPTLAGTSALMGAGLFLVGAVICRQPLLLSYFVPFVLVGGVQLAMSRGGWPADLGHRLHVALAWFCVLALAVRLVAWVFSQFAHAESFPGRFWMHLSRSAGGAIAFSLLGAAVAFFACAAELVYASDVSFVIASWVRITVAITLGVATVGFLVPTSLPFQLPRGALIIACVYLLGMWSGVFCGFEERRSLVTYWQVMASTLSAIMAFGIGVRVPGLVPIALLTVMPALVFAFDPPIGLFSCAAVVVAGTIYLRGAASIESQIVYYIGTMVTTAGLLMFVHELLPGKLPPEAKSVVVAAAATMLAVWWTVCATRGWVRPLRFIRAALDSGVLCSLIAAIALIAYLLYVGWGITSTIPTPPPLRPEIRLAAIGVCLSLVAYFVGAAAAFKSEFMVYVAEIALFGAAILLRVGFKNIFTDETMRVILPFLVLAMAFSFAGISEFLSRRGLEMFSRPISNTGIFLPLIAVLSLWGAMAGPDFDAQSSQAPLLIGGAGLFYFMASKLRRNRTFDLLAAVLFNLGVWFVYDQFNLRFQDVPQLMTVPIGLSIVLAANVMGDRLTPRAVSSLRYLGMLIIYISSAFQMFRVEDVSHSIFMLALSVIGVFVGVWLKVRSFVYLGVIFVVFTIVARFVHHIGSNELTWGTFLIACSLALFVVTGITERSEQRRDRADAGGDDEAEPGAETPMDHQ